MVSTKLASRFDTFVFDWDGTLNNLKLVRAINEKINPNWRHKKKMSTKMGEQRAGRDGTIYDQKPKLLRMLLLAPLFDASLFLMKPKLQSGVREALELLKRRDKGIAIFTNGAAYRVTKELSYLGILDYFDVVVSAQELKILKPNPTGLAVVADAIKAKKSRMLYAGDMVDDIVMAKQYGVCACGIAGGFDSYEKLKSAKPDYLFASFEGFKRAL